jgi:putative oxidoreductase
MFINQEAFLVFILRVILGILFFFQGYDKIFRVKISGVIEFFHLEMQRHKVPSVVLIFAAYFTSMVEFVGGGLLILGIFKSWAYYLLGLDLILVCGAFSMMKPMWDMNMVFPRLVILAILLYLPASWDLFSLDLWIFGK